MELGRSHRAEGKQAFATAGIAVVGFALFLSAVWTARYEASLVPEHTLFIARFTKVAGCFAIAFLFRSHIPSVRRLFAVGSSCIALHLAAYAAMTLSPASSQEHLALSICSGVFTGLGEACIILLYAHLFSTFAPKLSAIAIPVAYLLNEVLYCSTTYLLIEFVAPFRMMNKVLGLVLLLWCLHRKSSAKLAADEYPLQHGMSTKPEREPLLRFLSSSQDWMLILAGTTLFPLLFGLIAQMCSAVNERSGLYDPVNELVAIGLLALLVGYGLYRGNRFTFDEILYVAFPLFATGCLLLPVFWQLHDPYAELLVKCGYTAYQVLFWMLLARKCYEDLRHTYLYFGIFYGLFELSTAAARLAASALYDINVLDFQFIAYLSLFSLWLIALYGLIFFAISKRWQSESKNIATNRAYAEPHDASEPADPFAQKVVSFCDRYELSPREQEVLIETIHGYSMENIGKKLYVSRETVKTHLRRMYSKVGVSGKQELIALIDHYVD